MAARAYKRGGDPVAPSTGDRTLSPVVGAIGAPFFSRDLVANLKKKITLRACRPMGGRPGGIFEIIQNGHIFLKFLFFLNIKKKKPRLARSVQVLWPERRAMKLSPPNRRPTTI